MQIEPFAAEAGKIVETVGIGVLVAGAILAIAAFILRMLQRRQFSDAYRGLRADLGRAILLGLEFLVIADIIRTVAVEPTLQNLRRVGVYRRHPHLPELRAGAGGERALAVAKGPGGQIVMLEYLSLSRLS